MLGTGLPLACIAMGGGVAQGCLLTVPGAPVSQGEPVGWQCQVSPMALAGTALLWELGHPQQDRNPPRISWIHEAPSSLSPPANSRWCHTNWVQVSRAVLIQGTNLQDSSLGLSFLFLEHQEGRDTCTQPGGCTAHTRAVSTLTCTYMHTCNSLCASCPICTHSLCTHVVCEHSMRCPNVRTAQAHTHTSALTHACSDVHAPHCAHCPAHCCSLHPPAQPGQQPGGLHQPPLLLFDTRREHVLSPQHAAGSLSCQADPGSCLALLPFLEGLCWDLPALRV